MVDVWNPDTKLVQLLTLSSTPNPLPGKIDNITLGDLWRANGWGVEGQDDTKHPDHEAQKKEAAESFARIKDLTITEIHMMNHAIETHVNGRNKLDPKKRKWKHINPSDPTPCSCSWCAAVVSPDE